LESLGGYPETSFKAIKLLLRHGADFEQQCTYTSGSGGEMEAKASEMLKEWFDADQFGVLEDIVKRKGEQNQEKPKDIKEDAQPETVDDFQEVKDTFLGGL